MSIRLEDAFPDRGEVALDSTVMISERRYTKALGNSRSGTRTKLASRHLVVAFAILNIGISLAAV